jgi:glycosyltransferase involved in cell wall biosynthesis
VYERSDDWLIGNDAVELRHVISAYDHLSGYDLVHDHTLIGPALAANRTDLPPVVTTNHGEFNPDLSALYRYVAPTVPVIAISHHQASTAPGIPIAAVIHHGIDVDRYPLGAGTDGHVLFLGRMAASKGVDTAARAARAAGLRLVIAAKMREPQERAYFDTRVRPLLGDDIEYVGEVGHEQKLRLLTGAVALVNPIQWAEPFGMVMIEALACGTPVLAFPSGAAPEIIDPGRTGCLCPDEADLTAKLALVPTLSRTECRRAVAQRFSAARMVGDHLRLYRHIIHQRHLNPTGDMHLAAIA